MARRCRLWLLAEALTVIALSSCASSASKVLVSERSPDGSATLVVSHSHSPGCGSDGCVSVKVVRGSEENELFRDAGWLPCVAEAVWAPNSSRVAFVVSNCFSSASFGYLFDLREKRRLRLDSDGNLLRARILKRFRTDPGDDVLLWASGRAARRLYGWNGF